MFAALLTAFAVGARVGFPVSRRSVAIGAAGAVLVVVPALVVRALASSAAPHPAGRYLPWVLATAVVATAEEAFLRGALFAVVQRWRGDGLAVVTGAVAFALLHVPLYGWRAAPVDLAVGGVFGALRVLSGTWTAPAVAHVGADLAGWWLV